MQRASGLGLSPNASSVWPPPAPLLSLSCPQQGAQGALGPCGKCVPVPSGCSACGITHLHFRDRTQSGSLSYFVVLLLGKNPTLSPCLPSLWVTTQPNQAWGLERSWELQGVGSTHHPKYAVVSLEEYARKQPWGISIKQTKVCISFDRPSSGKKTCFCC